MAATEDHNIDIDASIASGRVRVIDRTGSLLIDQVVNFAVSGASIFLGYQTVSKLLPVAETTIERIIILLLAALTLIPVMGHLLNERLAVKRTLLKGLTRVHIENYLLEKNIPVVYKSNRLICAQKNGGLFSAGRTWIIMFDGDLMYLNTQTLNKDNWPSTFNYFTNQRHVRELMKFIETQESKK